MKVSVKGRDPETGYEWEEAVLVMEPPYKPEIWRDHGPPDPKRICLSIIDRRVQAAVSVEIAVVDLRRALGVFS